MARSNKETQCRLYSLPFPQALIAKLKLMQFPASWRELHRHLPLAPFSQALMAEQNVTTAACRAAAWQQGATGCHSPPFSQALMAEPNVTMFDCTLLPRVRHKPQCHLPHTSLLESANCGTERDNIRLHVRALHASDELQCWLPLLSILAGTDGRVICNNVG